MELRREIRWMIGGLMAVNLLLAFGAIGLLMRMGPAIERILQDNVYSIVAAEELLAELADAGGEPLSPAARERVQQSLAKAKQNVTENEEHSVLDAIELDLPTAMAGDAASRERAVASTLQLIQINRDAMQRVDEEARRLGGAGAWAAVFIGFTSFLLSIAIVARFQARFIRPLVDLFEVLESARQGNRFRRCRHAGAPQEIMQIIQRVNNLLDERLSAGRGQDGSFDEP